ncbi:MAG: pectate lyase [Polyangiaceae bacterium]
MSIRTRWLAGLVLPMTLLACSATPDPAEESTGGTTGNGGSGNGGATANGGSGQGGAAQGGSGQGGAGQGGASQGGSGQGGAGQGGSGQGGSGQGGSGQGGAGQGGSGQGGSGQGGAGQGGSGTGGRASGGAGTGGAGTGGAGTGGRASGGAGTGGAGTGGAGTGGKGTGGAGTGGATTNTGAGPTTTCGCTTSSGEFSGNNIKSTIVVKSGETYDGGCKTFRADPSSLGKGDQAEGQKPVFQVSGTLQNVILGASAADGIHIMGNSTLKNIHWLDIGEDAMTVKEKATLTLDCGSSANGEDKTFQVNAEATINIKNFTAKTAGKFMRQNGDTTFKMTVTIDHCDISNMGECIYRTDSSSSIVNMTNTRYHAIGDSLFIFGSTNVNGDTHAQVGTFTGNVSY